jgi:hypothetical protein
MSKLHLFNLIVNLTLAPPPPTPKPTQYSLQCSPLPVYLGHADLSVSLDGGRLRLAEGGKVVHCVIHILHTIGQYSSRDLQADWSGTCRGRQGSPLYHTHPVHHWSIQQQGFTNQQLSGTCRGRRGSPLCHTHPAHNWLIQQH